MPAKQVLDCDAQWARASALMDNSRYKKAAELFAECARRGHINSQLSLGYCYDYGLGLPRNRQIGLYWYRLAYRIGVGFDKAIAANNIGVTYLDWGNYGRALFWLRRAVNTQPPEEDARYLIAKIYARHPRSKHCALRELHFLLEKANPNLVTESTRELAQELLNDLTKKQPPPPTTP